MDLTTISHLLPPPPIPPIAKATIYLSVRWLLFETSTFISDDNLEKWTKSYNFRYNELKCHLQL